MQFMSASELSMAHATGNHFFQCIKQQNNNNFFSLPSSTFQEGSLKKLRIYWHSNDLILCSIKSFKSRFIWRLFLIFFRFFSTLAFIKLPKKKSSIQVSREKTCERYKRDASRNNFRLNFLEREKPKKRDDIIKITVVSCGGRKTEKAKIRSDNFGDVRFCGNDKSQHLRSRICIYIGG